MTDLTAERGPLTTFPTVISTWLDSLPTLPPLGKDPNNMPSEWNRMRELQRRMMIVGIAGSEETEYQSLKNQATNSTIVESLPSVLEQVLAPTFVGHVPAAAELGEDFQGEESDQEFTDRLRGAIKEGNPHALYLAAVVLEFNIAPDLSKLGEDEEISRRFTPVASLASALNKKFNTSSLIKTRFHTANDLFTSSDRIIG